MARKKSNDEGGGPNWLDTYADMVTLLLTFFVLLFSISSVDAQKWEILVKSFSGEENLESGTQIVVQPSEDKKNPNGITVGQDPELDGHEIDSPEKVVEFANLYPYLKKYVEDNELESDVSLYNGNGYVFIIFRNNIFFDGDSSVLKNEGKEILNVFTAAITNISEDIGKVSCDGHTARARATPNTVATDRMLSSDRAVNVVCYIQGKNIIDPAKLVSTGHGEFKPIVPHDGTEATRQKNRRVELCIFEKEKGEKTLDDIYAEINKNIN